MYQCISCISCTTNVNVQQRRVFLYYDSRLMWRIYFWRKAGGIRDFECPKTWAKITVYLMSNGYTRYGVRIVSLKMQKKSLFMRWAYPITIYGCITTRRCFICPSTNRDNNGIMSYVWLVPISPPFQFIIL